MQLKIEIPEAAVIERVVPASERTGFKGGTFYYQEGYAVLVDRNTGKANRFPSKIALPKEKGEPPYPVGHYELDSASFAVDQYDKLSLGRLKLSPVAPERAPASRGA